MMVVLYSYLVRHFVMWLMIVSLAFGSLILLADFLEMMRFAGKLNQGAAEAFYYTRLRFPHLVLDVAPFIFLFATVFCLLRLSETRELIVIRAAGISVWSFLAPLIVTALLLGGLLVGVLDPIGANGYNRFKEIQKGRGQDYKLTISDAGVWFRDETETGRFILQAKHLDDQENKILSDIRVLQFNQTGELVYQIKAKSGQLLNGMWRLNQARLMAIGQPEQQVDEFQLSTRLTTENFDQNFREPRAMGFAQLGRYIAQAEPTGVNVTAHKIRYNSLISLPFTLAAIVLLAACFSLPTGRLHSTAQTIGLTVLCGFALFLTNNFFEILGMQGRLPPLLASWAAQIAAAMLAITLLLNSEDG